MNEDFEKAIQRLGLRSYDTALPQEWVDDVKSVTGEYVGARGLFVWSYDGAGIFGKPVALNEAAEAILAQYTAAKRG